MKNLSIFESKFVKIALFASFLTNLDTHAIAQVPNDLPCKSSNQVVISQDGKQILFLKNPKEESAQKPKDPMEYMPLAFMGTIFGATHVREVWNGKVNPWTLAVWPAIAGAVFVVVMLDKKGAQTNYDYITVDSDKITDLINNRSVRWSDIDQIEKVNLFGSQVGHEWIYLKNKNNATVLELCTSLLSIPRDELINVIEYFIYARYNRDQQGGYKYNNQTIYSLQMTKNNGFSVFTEKTFGSFVTQDDETGTLSFYCNEALSVSERELRMSSFNHSDNLDNLFKFYVRDNTLRDDATNSLWQIVGDEIVCLEGKHSGKKLYKYVPTPAEREQILKFLKISDTQAQDSQAHQTLPAQAGTQRKSNNDSSQTLARPQKQEAPQPEKFNTFSVGELDMSGSSLDVELMTISSKKATFTNSTARNLQMIAGGELHLIGLETVINGNVEFIGEAGKVILSGGARVMGNIINATVEDKTTPAERKQLEKQAQKDKKKKK